MKTISATQRRRGGGATSRIALLSRHLCCFLFLCDGTLSLILGACFRGCRRWFCGFLATARWCGTPDSTSTRGSSAASRATGGSSLSVSPPIRGEELSHSPERAAPVLTFFICSLHGSQRNGGEPRQDLDPGAQRRCRLCKYGVLSAPPPTALFSVTSSALIWYPLLSPLSSPSGAPRIVSEEDRRRRRPPLRYGTLPHSVNKKKSSFAP